MISKKAISEYQSVQKMAGSNYPDKRVEEIVKRGVKYNIEIFQNEELINSMLIEKLGNNTVQNADRILDILNNLIECETDAQIS